MKNEKRIKEWIDLQVGSAPTARSKNTRRAMLATNVNAPMPKIAVKPAFSIHVILSLHTIVNGNISNIESVVILKAALAI